MKKRSRSRTEGEGKLMGAVSVLREKIKYNAQTVVSIIVCCPEISNIKYTRIPSTVYQNMVKLIVGFPTWRHPSIFMNVPMWKHSIFVCEVFRCGKVDYPKSMIITDFV
jgi:hypothetical protein